MSSMFSLEGWRFLLEIDVLYEIDVLDEFRERSKYNFLK
jgi:hypothetical protein